MRKKKEGLTLGEKIEIALEQARSKQCSKLIDDAFLAPVIVDGSQYYSRYTNLLRENGRKRDIVDEVLVAQQQQAELEKVEALRDRTFEEFKLMNEDFIEGRQTQQRSAKISNDDAKSHRSKSNKGKGIKKQKNKSSAGDEENEDDDDKSQKSRKADEETAKMINK